MVPLFLGLTLANFVCLLTAAALGYFAAPDSPASAVHRLVGTLATLVCCGVHCVVFTYFIATAKWVLHAIEVKRLDPALAAPTRSFKMLAFPAALAAMGSVFAAAIAGAVVDSYHIRPGWHLAAALLMLATNALAALAEYRAITRNGALIRRILQAGPSTTTA